MILVSPCPGDRQKDETAIKNDRADYICNYMVLKGVLSREVYTGRGRVKFTEGQVVEVVAVVEDAAF
nr:hypothetical protein BaRGS_004822 [Batillaria attramentaria]